MSELEARKYTSIRNLREEIRADMEDYKLLWTDENVGQEGRNGPSFLFDANKEGIRNWFSKYLISQINNNLSKLKELVEQNNE